MEPPNKIKDPEGRKARQMAHAMSTYCCMLGGLAWFYFIVFAVTNLAPMSKQSMAPSLSSQLLLPAARTTLLPPDGCNPASCASLPTSASDSSQSDKPKSHISVWNGFTAAFLLGAMYLIATVKPRVDAAAKAEDRAATEEDKAYNAALDERRKAHDAAYRAKEDVKRAVDGIPPPLVPPPPGAMDPRVAKLLIVHYKAVIATEKADKKAEERCPLVGVARMGGFERRAVRILFAISILYSFAAGICSSAAYFRSAELELGDLMSLGAVIGSIAVPGVPFVWAHFCFLYVAFRGN